MPTKTTPRAKSRYSDTWKRVVPMLVAVVLAGCASSQAEPAKYARSSPEYQLAVIDHHGAQPTNSQVEPYVTVLNQLQARCTDSRRQLTEWASDIKENFTGDSEMHLLKMALEQVDRANAVIGPSARRGSCKEVFLLVGVAAKEGA
jgi:hypothetical protein